MIKTYLNKKMTFEYRSGLNYPRTQDKCSESSTFKPFVALAGI